MCNITYSYICSHAYAWLDFSFFVQILIIREVELEPKAPGTEGMFQDHCQEEERGELDSMGPYLFTTTTTLPLETEGTLMQR